MARTEQTDTGSCKYMHTLVCFFFLPEILLKDEICRSMVILIHL